MNRVQLIHTKCASTFRERKTKTMSFMIKLYTFSPWRQSISPSEDVWIEMNDGIRQPDGIFPSFQHLQQLIAEKYLLSDETEFDKNEKATVSLI